MITDKKISKRIKDPYTIDIKDLITWFLRSLKCIFLILYDFWRGNFQNFLKIFEREFFERIFLELLIPRYLRKF